VINKRFITFEGGEGSGKTTQIKILKKKLLKYGDVITTREPGGSPNAEIIRDLLVKGEKNRWSEISELLLINAARKDHLENIILNALENEKFVLCDRFTDSTIAYQGYGKGLDINLINKLNLIVTKKLKPKITFLLNIKPDIGLKRSRGRKNIELRYENMPIKYHRIINASFLKIAKENSKRFVVIDASKDKEEISDIIWKKVKNKLISD
tara:strand:+ start:608 stop:1237 length:630 start_codon:yes stop_codon:yes gene_type:complete